MELYFKPKRTDPQWRIESTCTNITLYIIERHYPPGIYDGRTPCQDYAAEHQLNVTADCFKLKWRLILNRDAITHKPTTYTIRKVVDNIPQDVSGNWRIIKGIKENPNAIIYQLDPEYPQNSICLLAGDDHVLFFLDKKYRLHAGNGDFSYTLNRKP